MAKRTTRTDGRGKAAGSIAALEKHRMKPGDPSRNPKGRPPLPKEIKEWMANKTEEAVETLYDVMMNGANDAARVKAAEYFLAPFVSKAAQKVEHDVTVSTIGDFLARASAAKAVLDTQLVQAEVIEALGNSNDLSKE